MNKLISTDFFYACAAFIIIIIITIIIGIITDHCTRCTHIHTVNTIIYYIIAIITCTQKWKVARLDYRTESETKQLTKETKKKNC